MERPGQPPRGVEVIERRLGYRGFFTLEILRLRHERFAGDWSEVLTRELFRQRRVTAVLPYDPRRDRVLLVEQFRTGALGGPEAPWIIEAPAGLAEPGEAPEAVARRELLEETGLTVGRLEPALRFWASPGASSELVDLFIAEADLAGAGGIDGHAEEGEDILSHVVAAETAFAWLDAGRVTGMSGVVALLWLRVHRAALRQRWDAVTELATPAGAG